MSEPLLTESSAHARVGELRAAFDHDPDVLSPDEQALVIALRMLERTGQDVIATLRTTIAGQIEALSRSHYARDIRGTLALQDWERLAEALRQSNHVCID